MRARVERFGEPALLALLAARPTHGYELIEQLPDVSGDDRVDVGNLYRALRALEVSERVECFPVAASRGRNRTVVEYATKR